MPTLSLFLESETSLDVRRVFVHEGLSTLFEVSVWALSPKPDVDLEAIVGRAARLSIEAPILSSSADNSRSWNGICARCEQLQAEPTGLSTYQLRLVPALWMLTQTRGHRIFQHASVPEIVDAVFGEHDIAARWQIERGDFPKLDIRIQYGESDYAFVCRLLEEVGIAFRFESDGARTTLVLDDNMHQRDARQAPPIPYAINPNRDSNEEFVSRLLIGREVRPSTMTEVDYAFRSPRFANVATHAAAGRGGELYDYGPGAFLVEKSSDDATPVADDRGASRVDLDHGRKLTRRRLESERGGAFAVHTGHNVLELAAGVVFSVANHPHPLVAENRTLLATETTIEGSYEDELQMTARAVSTAQPYRPPRKTPRPRVQGVQTATVVGPKNSEIHTDEFGRVRVAFPWDRDATGDDASSCWLRVSQGAAGTGFGLLAIPRVGQEVLVSFLDGSPDQPIVVGRVFNAVDNVPYKLPEHMTKSVWRTQTSPGGDGFNELMFEDAAGQELLFMRAQKDHVREVIHDESITVSHNRDKEVTVDETETVGGDRRESIGGDRVMAVGGNRRLSIEKDESIVIRGSAHSKLEGSGTRIIVGDNDRTTSGVNRSWSKSDRHDRVGGDRRDKVEGKASLTVLGAMHATVGSVYALAAGDEVHLAAGSSCVIESPDITLKGDGGFVRIDATGVTIKGTTVFINSGGSPGSGTDAAPDEPDDAQDQMEA